MTRHSFTHSHTHAHMRVHIHMYILSMFIVLVYVQKALCYNYVVVQELTALHDVLTKERAEHDLVVKGLKQELLTTNNR